MSGLFGDLPQPSLEAQVVDMCDEIAYNNHDIDDGLASGLLSLPQVLDGLPLWREAWEAAATAWPDAPHPLQISETVRSIIDRQTTDLMSRTLERLRRYVITTPDEARARTKPLVGFSTAMEAFHQQQRRFLYESLYRHPDVIAATEEATRALRVLFSAFLDRRLAMTNAFNAIEIGEPPVRRIIDELACMTDDQALTVSAELA